MNECDGEYIICEGEKQGMWMWWNTKKLSSCQSVFNYLEGKCVEPKKISSDTRKTSSDKIKFSSK